MRISLGLTFAAALCICAPAFAEEGSAVEDKLIEGNVSVGVFSDYMFRGANLYAGSAVQPSVSLATVAQDWGSIGASVWHHSPGDGTKSGTLDTFKEVDYTLNYAYKAGDLSLGLGHVWYTYPHSDVTESAEMFATVAYDTFLTPSFSYYRDYDAFDMSYYELNFSQAIDLPMFGEGVNVSPFMSLGFASGADEVYEDDGLVQITYGIATDLAWGDINVRPTFNYTDGQDDNTVNEFWFGTTLSYGF